MNGAIPSSLRPNPVVLRPILVEREKTSKHSNSGHTDNYATNRSRIGINKWYQSFALRNFDLEDMEFESAHSMLAIDGVGFDWSDMAEEQVQTNMALMAFSDSEVYTDKTCLKNYKTLKKQCDDMIVKLNQTEFIAVTYKRGLATVEEQLITYWKNGVLFSEEVAVLKREVACKDYKINVLKSKFEKVKQEKEGIEFKIEKFDKASKHLDKLPKKLDLSYSGLDEFKEPEFKGYGTQDKQVSKDTSSFVESLLNVDKETIFVVDKKGKPQQDDTLFVDSGCSRYMTGNIAYLSDFKEFDEGYVSLFN
ncbi:hypothetical protein Tco_0083792 [Tanacetum coccineum]